MKKILIRGVIVLAVVAVVAVVGFVLFLGNIVKAGVETVGPKLTKTTVALDKASFSLLAGRMTLDGLVVGNPEGFKTPSAIKVGELTLRVKPGSVLSDVIEIDELTIVSPEITYEQALSGNNINKLLANVNESTAAIVGTTDQPADPAAEKRFKVKVIRVTGAKVNASATLMGGTALTLPLPDITLENIGTAGNGVTAGELTGEVLKQVLAGVTKAVTSSALQGGDALKDAGKEAGKTLEKATEGVRNLFNR